MFCFKFGSVRRKNAFVTVQKACLIAILVGVCGVLAAEPRTWTFSQDGQMKTPSGGLVSFKKNGRLDAIFVRLETTNVVLLVRRGESRSLPAKSLSAPDLEYIARLTKPAISPGAAGGPKMTSAVTEKKIQATRLRNHAAATRQLATMARESAADLEAKADSMAGPVDKPPSQDEMRRQPNDPLTLRLETSFVKSEPAKTRVGTSPADEFSLEAAHLRQEAEEKREQAATMETEAAKLEEIAQDLDTREPASR
jgi:hypothetical protein